jgi:hypothetical protein
MQPARTTTPPPKAPQSDIRALAVPRPARTRREPEPVDPNATQELSVRDLLAAMPIEPPPLPPSKAAANDEAPATDPDPGPDLGAATEPEPEAVSDSAIRPRAALVLTRARVWVSSMGVVLLACAFFVAFMARAFGSWLVRSLPLVRTRGQIEWRRAWARAFFRH